MSRLRIVIIAIAIVQICVAIGLHRFMASLDTVKSSNQLTVYALLTVGAISLATQYNKFGISLVLFGNFILTLYWTLGLIQRIPGFLSHGLDSAVAIAAGLSLVVIIPCALNMLALFLYNSQTLDLHEK